MNTFTIYLWGILDDVRIGCIYLICVAAVLAIAPILVIAATSGKGYLETHEDYESRRQKECRPFFRFTKIFLPISLALLMIRTLIPSSNTFAAIVIIPEITNSDVIKKDLPDLYKAAMDKLKESLEVEKKPER